MPKSITEVKLTCKTYQKRILMNAFFKSQFNYCPLVWMCRNRSWNTKINRLHERCLRIVCNDKKSNFNELLVKDGSVFSIRHQNLQKLAVKMFKISAGLNPEIIKELFQFREQLSYESRQSLSFKSLGFIQFLEAQKALNFLGQRYG